MRSPLQKRRGETEASGDGGGEQHIDRVGGGARKDDARCDQGIDGREVHGPPKISRRPACGDAAQLLIDLDAEGKIVGVPGPTPG